MSLKNLFHKKNKEKEICSEGYGTSKEEPSSIEFVGKYFYNKDQPKTGQIISDRTCKDLNIDELFDFIDRTHSKIGEQFLYNRLRTIPENPKDLSDQEYVISQIGNDRNLRLQLKKTLQKLDKPEAYSICSIFQEEHLKRPKWFFIIPVLSLISLSLLVASAFISKLFIPFICVFIINLWFHYSNKKNLYSYISTLPQLHKLNIAADCLSKLNLLQEQDHQLKRSIKEINQLKGQMSFLKMEESLQSDVGELLWGVLELIKIGFLVEPILLFHIIDKLENKRSEINEIFDFVGKVDTLQSIASLRLSLPNYCIPDIHAEPKTLQAEALYHPLIENCISNNVKMNYKSMLLTGSNMSGKTTFIRTIGVNALTAFTINTSFAKSFSLPRMNIWTAIRINDDLLNDKSYYFEEVLTIKEMIDKSQNGQANLFLLDEIFKGTNTIERISAGKAVLSSLNQNTNLVFVSTHDIELADLLKTEYDLYHFNEQVQNDTIYFDYKLKTGKLKFRNAIRILEINNYPSHITNEAFEISENLEEMNMISKRSDVNE